MLEFVFNKVTSLQASNFVKKRLQHRCFAVKFAKFLRTPFFAEHFQSLLRKNQCFAGVMNIILIDSEMLPT